MTSMRVTPAVVCAQGESQGEHILILCNAIGSPVDSKVIELDPKFVALTGVCSIGYSQQQARDESSLWHRQCWVCLAVPAISGERSCRHQHHHLAGMS
jgi:hypothetical protein